MEHEERLKAALADRYQIEREIGSGGMAKVYLAQDLKHNRQVAVKVLDPDLAQSLGAERFLGEIETVANLTHPHILPLFDSGEADGFLFYVMPYVEGESLRSRLTKEKQLPVEDAIQITREIANALTYAHEKGVIHRDVKPANIMLEAGHAVLADFGIAHAVSEAKDDRITRTGTSLGTPAYMSPEQATGERDLNGRSDQYALGCVLFEMLAGHPPFSGARVEAVVRQHLMEEPPPVAQSRPAVTDEVAKVIGRALSKNPADRFKTAAEMAAELGLTTSPPQGGPELSRKPRKFLSLTSPLVALTLVSVTLLALIIARDPRPPSVPTVGRTTRLTQEPGLELEPAVSPDGTMVAYVARRGNGYSILVQQVNGGTPLSLFEEFQDPVRSPDWSPDGAQVLFATGNSIYVVPVLGGIPRRVITGEAIGPVYSPVWSPDGQHIAFAQAGGIFLAQADGRGVEKLADASFAAGLSWSPDGNQIAYSTGITGYSSGSDLQGSGSLWVVSLEEKEPQLVLDDGAQNVNPVWAPNGDGLLFVSNRGGGRDLFFFPYGGSSSDPPTPIRITSGQSAHTVSLSTGGSILAFSRLTQQSNIGWQAVPSSRPGSIGQLEALTMGAQVIESFSFSPDGVWIAFDSDRSGNQDIYKMRVEGGDPIRLTNHAADDFAPTWSPDGRQIVFHSMRTGNRDLFQMSEDGAAQEPILETPEAERLPAWAPDGDRIAFWSKWGPDRELRLLHREAPDRPWTLQQIVPLGEIEGRVGLTRTVLWSPDGSSLAISWEEGVHFIDLGTERPKGKVIDLGFQPLALAWSPSPDEVWYSSSESLPEATIWAVGVPGESIKVTTVSLPPDTRLRSFRVLGNRIFFVLEAMESNVWIANLTWPE